jgi:chlorobactene glucosyltransferase
MIIEIIFTILIILSTFIIGVRLYNFVSKNILSKSVIRSNELISVLVPMRNEEENVAKCIENILKQKYTNYEVIVYDDESTDKTLELLQTYASKNRKLKIIEGKNKPKDWLGKNWACWNLANQAKGDILLFIDADVELKENAIESALIQLKKDRVQMLSIFPFQKCLGIGEKIVVPSFLVFLYSFLPIRIIKAISSASIAAANGQFMMWQKNIYFEIGGHKSVYNKIVEDVSLARLLKKVGYKMSVYFARENLVSCRMYSNFWSGFKGVSKIYMGIINFNPLIYLLIVTLLTSILLFPFVLPFIVPEVLFFTILYYMSGVLLNYKLGYRDFIFVGLHFVHYIVLICSVYYSLYVYSFKKLQWKERKIL